MALGRRRRSRPGGSAAVATSGLNVRIWHGDGRYAHHLLDPSTGEPALPGLIGATFLGDTAVEAKAFAKAALLSGPEGGRMILDERGALLVYDDGRVETVGPLSARPGIRLPDWTVKEEAAA
jgi:FAD:protein FMN transferase